MGAKWIWYPGDFELYHSMLLHARREEYGYAYPVMWHVSRPECLACFSTIVDLAEDVTATVYARGKGYVNAGGRRLGGLNQAHTFPKGRYDLTIEVSNVETFPAIFIDADGLCTDESWVAHFDGAARRPVGCENMFTRPEDDPAVFPFAYSDLTPVSTEPVEGGVLYDFGVESFGPVVLDRTQGMGAVTVRYGESREEALDREYCLLFERVPEGDGAICLAPRAFRYIFVETERGGDTPCVSAQLEYLPTEDVASFKCDDERLPQIWDICARAFHLNTREFFLDGVKRDRWVWSGDAYQSYMVSRYLYGDQSVTRRTIRALLDRPPYVQHINTINDYSAYMFLAVRDHWFATGDTDFVRSVWDQLQALYAFITERLDEETGYVVCRPGDWIFIDWADMDKGGPLCAEQILLWQVYLAMDALSKVMAEDRAEISEAGANHYSAMTGAVVPFPETHAAPDYLGRAEALKKRIMADFWDEDRHAFIDTYASGRRNVTRHANIFAILYDFVDEATQRAILRDVLLTDAYPEITTPYFKLFELMAFAKLGHIEAVQDYIDSYWGGMLDNGATSAWEEYIPSRSGTEHYEMYGDKYGCSLCHAWGAGPIVLLGRYCAGVRSTSAGSATFEVAPVPGRYGHFEAVVPIAGGRVRIAFENGRVTACADVPGGTLRFAGQEKPLPQGESVTIG
ncbi:MAG: hypothetical protein E7317_12085 [Clostridiales bacterium]|nr:hypothetical protein [Clostridiales bacterium]